MSDNNPSPIYVGPRTACPSHQFQCDSSECIDIALVCDGEANCPDGSDEGENCPSDQCPTDDQSQCAHVCYKTPRGTVGILFYQKTTSLDNLGAINSEERSSTHLLQKCGCRPGFKLQEDGLSCGDVDECMDNRLNICSHFCKNTEGFFVCHCNEGYVLEPDGHSCKIKGKFVNSKMYISETSF